MRGGWDHGSQNRFPLDRLCAAEAKAEWKPMLLISKKTAHGRWGSQGRSHSGCAFLFCIPEGDCRIWGKGGGFMTPNGKSRGGAEGAVRLLWCKAAYCAGNPYNTQKRKNQTKPTI